MCSHITKQMLCVVRLTRNFTTRDDIRCNLLGAYYRLLEFIHKHLPDRAYLDGNQRVSLREMIFREVVANLLVHREFSNAYPATLTIFKDTVVTENWNRPYTTGRFSLENLKPHPKNPIIANFFKQLGWVEELGSGVRKMYKYCPIYVYGAMPIIEDGDVFKLTIRHEAEAVGVNVGVNDILNIISKNEGINGATISEKLPEVTKRTVERYLQKLRESGVIEFRGASKMGGYYILKLRKYE